jgi:hypothetical protein
MTASPLWPLTPACLGHQQQEQQEGQQEQQQWLQDSLQEGLLQLQEDQHAEQLLQRLTLTDSQLATGSTDADSAARSTDGDSSGLNDVDAAAAPAAAAAADPSVAWQLPPAPAPVRIQSDSTRSNSGSNGSAAGGGSGGVAGGVELVRPVLWPMQVRPNPALQSSCSVAGITMSNIIQVVLCLCVAVDYAQLLQ